MIIAIDGPAGSGKSTTARGVADALGFVYIDTGAMYRAVTLAVLRSEVPDGPIDWQHLLQHLSLRFGDSGAALLNGEDVSEAIRTPEVTDRVSEVAAVESVRHFLVAQQRQIAQESLADGHGVVMEGRDIGTVVFPEAGLKVFLIADVAERARRRTAELIARGHAARHRDVETDLRRRDDYDSSRSVSPLRQADDARVLDTTGLTVAQQVARIVDWAQEPGT